MKSIFISGESGEVHCLAWGKEENPLILLIHGLGGQAANYQVLSENLSKTYFVISVDLPGRGLSCWGPDPASDYSFAKYEAVIHEVLDHFKVKSRQQVRIVGTSMGGALAIRLASSELKERVSHVVINDIGPTLPKEVGRAIAESVRSAPVFDSIRQIVEWLSDTFGEMANVDKSHEYWEQKVRYFIRRLDSGKYSIHFDPRIVDGFIQNVDDFEQWDNFLRMESKTLVIRGGLSEVLPENVLLQMKERRPTIDTITYPNAGHAPLLESASEIDAIRSFLK